MPSSRIPTSVPTTDPGRRSSAVPPMITAARIESRSFELDAAYGGDRARRPRPRRRRRSPARERAQHVQHRSSRADPHAAEPRRALVAADREHVRAEARVAEQEPNATAKVADHDQRSDVGIVDPAACDWPIFAKLAGSRR